MTRDELFARWQARRADWKRFGVHVEGAVLADEVLADLALLEQSEGDEILSLAAASSVSGYSRDHLARLIRQGTIPNAGRPNAPRVRRRDLPRKIVGLQSADESGISRAQIARSVVNSLRERNDG
jgi:hypothetical protein